MEIIIKDIKVKSILTKSNLPVGGYSVNPYVGCTHACKYCYASFMKRFTNHTEPWGEFIDIKLWTDIKNTQKYKDKELFISSVTDPYQPIEETACRTRTLLEQLKGSGCKISISTKSDLVLRDLDIIKTFPNARVSWSINTLDENFRADMDNAVSIERRLKAMKEFYDAGIRTTCFISPIFPYITNIKDIIRRVKNKCNLIWLENLNLRGAYKKVILDYIEEKYPELKTQYDDIYLKGSKRYWFELDEQISKFCKEEGLLYVRNDDSINQPFNAPPIVVNYFFHEEIIPSANKKTKA
ncbi:radical SAM mobile pair protein B [Brachyspira innocens]|uniref:Radical SAM mobile pair protein B n=1 Tax=Brachyspira innocens TaxID=13264 RepID=A0ABT8YWJ3_9SPIR|nr:radical SAM mobile pair protein B [Brachyspira innocens]MDO6994337.1 radical SAM mobile pair protein B [Brachyspira innocens]MDO7019915.1 radical SAM mobile pair protein B [Brachyspira innocens]